MTRGAVTRQDIAAFIERHAEAFGRHDPTTLASHHTLDGTVVSPIFATVRGRPAIEDSYRALFTAFPDWTFHVDDVIIDSPKVVVLFTTTATHTSDFFGIPGTNKRFEINGARCMTLEDGLIAHERRIYDFTGMLIQVGVLRAKPGKP